MPAFPDQRSHRLPEGQNSVANTSGHASFQRDKATAAQVDPAPRVDPTTAAPSTASQLAVGPAKGKKLRIERGFAR